MPNQIPLDPTLPVDFDNTPNEQRSIDELDAWWDQPYGRSLPDGKIEVRCLNGGAWDRSTRLGVADNYEQACILAEQKQSTWVRRRGMPFTKIEDGKYHLVILPQRPDHTIQSLGQFESPEALQNFMMTLEEARVTITNEAR